ncbi:hypothetical protein OG555_36970 [Kribbella sp. NBC_01484]|uniref:hypothetical protein n=1 Tax=Kribbella sp. NBC_01484 TaxID=2903579 RepID=UPI002E34CC46|nr:hypothetical protein [Kribbella sp. NBC_01484]
MEPVSVAAVTSLLVTYGRHLLGIVGDVVDEGVAERLKALWERVRSRFAGDQQAEGALQRLAEQPDNERRQAAVEDHLDEFMRADPEFMAALTELVAKLAPQREGAVEVNDAGVVALGGTVNIRGRFAAGRDIITGDQRGKRPR